MNYFTTTTTRFLYANKLTRFREDLLRSQNELALLYFEKFFNYFVVVAVFKNFFLLLIDDWTRMICFAIAICFGCGMPFFPANIRTEFTADLS